MQLGEAIQAIKSRLSLLEIAGRYINLRPNGTRFIAPCPFHQETKPSFYISEDKGTFYCFGCQASGDIIEFHSRINGIDFRESVSQLAEEAGISIDSWSNGSVREEAKTARTIRQTMLAMHEAAASWFEGALARDSGRECRAYIEKRGLSPAIVERFGLGWAEREWHPLRDFLSRKGFNGALGCECGLLAKSASGRVYDHFRGRLMFPIRNLSNQVIAFGGRIIADEEEAKYINSAETPIYSKKEHLYGLAQARRSICAKGSALLTEGYLDVLTLHQFGFENGVAALGTALTSEQIKRLGGFTSKVDLVFDGDAPGRKAALRASSMFLCQGMACRVIMLPDGEDIDSLLRGAGPGAFGKLQAEAADGFAFCLNAIRELAPRDALAWAKAFLANIRIPDLLSHYITLLSQGLGVSETVFREAPPQIRKESAPNKYTTRDLCEMDTQIMLFLVRYPEMISHLREIGADVALATDRARKFWSLIERHGETDVVYYLDEKQKKFWQSQRGPQAPPRTNGERELACLRASIERYYARRQAACIQASLSNRVSDQDFAGDLEFLCAIRDTIRKSDEQS